MVNYWFCYGPISVIVLFDKWKETEIVSVDAMDLIAEVGMVLGSYKISRLEISRFRFYSLLPVTSYVNLRKSVLVKTEQVGFQGHSKMEQVGFQGHSHL